MKKKIIFGVIALAFVTVLIWFGKMNSKSVIEFDTEKPFKTNIVKKTVATGKVTPLEEVEIKPQISGIIDKIFVEEGEKVKKGDLIAKVRVVPNEQSLSNARGRIGSIQIQLNNAKISYDRNKGLYDKGVISRSEFENVELAYNQAKQDLQNAQNDYQIIRKGYAGSGGAANTNIRATTSGMVLEVPVKEGYQVIESNNFNAGTTIAFIADMNKMIFEGQVDEAEVGKIKKDIDLEITLGAVEDKKFPAKLTFIAPKGTEESGAVQFTIKADVTLDDSYFLRAGYSANAEIILEEKDSVLSIREALLQFDKKTEKPYVEVKTGEDKFERRDIKTGISDGINVEILSGITADDELKVWNKMAKKDDEPENS
ncbi:efflux RND transporter periplasmic adaptor subunit [Aureibaculum sp. 2210JD6-5]|uniref:efflux RND transporter periplasmic adaptor subunit n=1 Tax=Aureibaculum sp. 2210JD6-5 TaxID=3103957 RepID=UPI002AADE63F|nr:efflux RND transporter periplasmic adaptor subunit [Aureibaculum sp. 2210JD6-5]MDY7393809.1 efflux RND transporter periplasmic adaptor subunit [Aureibaculum sp. 2210JD6-5]